MLLESFDIYKYYEENPIILDTLLLDHTTKKNIIWATDNYIKRGYKSLDFITPHSILLKRKIIKARIEKNQTEQKKRSKDMAEVFTPSWVCNKQNNLIDNAWFGYENVFNIEEEHSWKSTEKVLFNNKSWEDYINDIRLEITCGEAPYLVSRYDTVSGELIPLNNRIGLLDRKMRVINENVIDKEEWIKCSLQALKSIYGYEFQGDNLFIARQNIFISYIEYYFERFNEMPSKKLMEEVSNIISWNIWQMDGLKMVVPFSCKTEIIKTVNLFGEEEVTGYECLGCKKNDIHNHNGKYCNIMDWEKNKKIKFVSLIKRGV